ncbi:TonB-dependent receptor domain-containing protein [Chitinimonas sp.]|uniref:TonB-dependent receptor domain-containing protein n=1 Tax=Chitinimonas sp. TaxID=1934313 RepID=UPI0035B3C621
MSKRHSTPLKPLALLLAVSFSPLAHAEVGVLDTVSVTAQRGNDTNTVVRSQRIEVEQASSLRDLFKQTPEVDVAGGLGVSQKLYVRGIGERMLAVTIDGAAQPESAYHHNGQVMVEPELLKRVEIEAGTGAATAGPGALAGALRFTTKRADDLLRAGQRFGALLKGGYQGASEGRKYSAALYGKLTDSLGVLASISEFDSDDYRIGGGGRVANSASDISNRFIKFDGQLDGGHRYALAYERYADEGLRNKRTNLAPAPFNPSERQRSNRDSTTFNYDYAPGSALLALHLTAYQNKNEVHLAMGKPTEETAGTRSRGFNISNVSRLAGHKLSYGFDYRRDTGFAKVPKTPLNDETATVKGLYLQDDVALGELFAAGIGARYDRFDYVDAQGQRFASNGASPSASLSFMPNEQWTVQLSHARALRGVGIVEPFLKQFQDNDAHIDAEKARNTELSLQWQSGVWRANLGGYQQDIDNYIGYDDYRDNMGKVQVRGYSASAGYQGDRLAASLGVSSAKPRLNGQPLSDGDALLLGNSTGRSWVAQVDYALPALQLKLGWTGRLVQKLEAAAGQRAKAGYGVHDIYAQWLPTGKDDFTATLSIKNLFDKLYYDQASFGYHPRWGKLAGFAEPGRDIRLQLAWRM